MTDGFFALGLSEHRIWGLILIPLILKKKESDIFYTSVHTVFPDEEEDSFLKLSHTEKEVVRIVDEYSDKKLFDLFSKNKSIKEFQNKVTDEKIAEFIRPYIEKRLVKILETVRGTKVNVFLRDKSRSNIFDEDFLTIKDLQAEPVIHLLRGEDASRYSLALRYNGNTLKLRDQFTDILSNKPAVVRINNDLIFIRDIEATKVRPFFTKDFINIPLKSEYQFFKTFALNIIRDFDVVADGFEIRNIHPEKSATISLETGLYNNATLTLRFNYNKRKILANSSQKVFVDFHKGNDTFRFDKYPRDEEFENRYHELLNDLGLITYDQVNYELKGSRNLDFETQANNLVEWINTNTEELEDPSFTFINSLKDREYYTGKVILELSSELHEDWFDIRAWVKIGTLQIEFYEFRNCILNNIRTFRLPDGKIFVIPAEWFGRLREIFEFGKVEKAGSVFINNIFSSSKKRKKVSAVRLLKTWIVSIPREHLQIQGYRQL